MKWYYLTLPAPHTLSSSLLPPSTYFFCTPGGHLQVSAKVVLVILMVSLHYILHTLLPLPARGFSETMTIKLTRFVIRSLKYLCNLQ